MWTSFPLGWVLKESHSLSACRGLWWEGGQANSWSNDRPNYSQHLLHQGFLLQLLPPTQQWQRQSGREADPL